MSVLHQLEAFYDALPRPVSRAEEFGPLRLFVRQDGGWPYYARPSAAGVAVSGDDVLAVRERQRELGVPEAFEWVHDLVPSMAGGAAQAGLAVRMCPLMVLGGSVPEAPAGVACALLDADSADLAAAEAVAGVAFRSEGTGTGPEGPAERDALAEKVSAQRLDAVRTGIRDGSAVRVVAALPGEAALPGLLAVGGLQSALRVAEVVGVGTLPAARRRGLAGAVTARLAQVALDRGMRLVFLSAGDEAVARVYERVGFRRVGTAGLAEPAQAS